MDGPGHRLGGQGLAPPATGAAMATAPAKKGGKKSGFVTPAARSANLCLQHQLRPCFLQ